MLSRVARWIQNGQVQRYIVGLVIGGALVFLVATRAHEPTFTYQAVPAGIELRAEPGEGIAGTDAHFRWDLDGDGQPDRRLAAAGAAQSGDGLLDDRVLVVRPGDLGSKVTLWIDSPLDGKTITVTRDIHLGDSQLGAEPAATDSAPSATGDR